MAHLDFDTLLDLLGKRKLAEVEKALASGVDPNLACTSTGQTLLLRACEMNNFPAVKLLLAHGANPNLEHNDGYNCYDTTRSKDIRRFIVERGFDLALGNIEESAFHVGYRLFAARSSRDDTRRLKLMNAATSVVLEYKLYEFPVSNGEVCISVEPEMKPFMLTGPLGSLETLEIKTKAPTTFELTVTAKAFQGDLRVRIYSEGAPPFVRERWP